MLVLCLIAAFVSLLWGTWMLVRGSLLVGCLIYLIVAACFGYHFFHMEWGPANITLDWLIFGVLMLAATIHRYRGQTLSRPWTSGDWGLVALLGWLGFSAWSPDFFAFATDPTSPLWRLITGYFVAAALYWIARQTPVTRRDVKIVRNALICFALYLSLVGILEVSQQWRWVFPRQIADRHVGLDFGQARGPMLASVSFGLYLAIGFLAGGIAWARLSLWPQLMLLFAFPLATASLYFSDTRSVWIGTLVGVLIALVATVRGKLRKVVLAPICSACLVFVAMNLAGWGGGLGSGVAAPVHDGGTYLDWWTHHDQPLVGYGFGYYADARWSDLSRAGMAPIASSRTPMYPSTLLSLLTETGLIGLGLFLLVCVAWCRSAWRIYRSRYSPAWARQFAVWFLAAFAVYACQLLAHEMSLSPLNNALVFFLAGLVTSVRQTVVRPMPQDFTEVDVSESPAEEPALPVWTPPSEPFSLPEKESPPAIGDKCRCCPSPR